jgi:ATP-dependent metalloprotease
VSLKHFEWAKVCYGTSRSFVSVDHAQDRILMGAEGKSRYIDAKNKLATAYHEVRTQKINRIYADYLRQGGHALVALYTEGAMPLHKVTCIPRGHALGYVRFLLRYTGIFLTYSNYSLSRLRNCPRVTEIPSV